ncbi:hypothetical protein [Kineococcus arenarius]|uniref:hypothetical protein n=1 Tax=unclassified Kineococcus TaxID=2621656 RepID=UPI003D7DB102
MPVLTAAPTGASTSPIPGDPAALPAAAERLAGTGERLHELRDTTAAHADAATANWSGAAAHAAETTLQRSTGYVASYAGSTERAAPILRTYAHALQRAQADHAAASTTAALAAADLATVTTRHTEATSAVRAASAAPTSAPASASTAGSSAGSSAGPNAQVLTDLHSQVSAAAAAADAAAARLHLAQQDMAAAWAALAAADAAATAALNAVTGRLQELTGAVTTSRPAPPASSATGTATGSATLPPATSWAQYGAAGAGTWGAATLAQRLHARSTPAPDTAHEDEDEDGGGLSGWLADRLDDGEEFVQDHAEGLRATSNILKGVSAVAGVASFIPGVNAVAAPIAVASGAAALGIDASVKYATGGGSWTAIVVDATLMALPGVGRLADRALGGALSTTADRLTQCVLNSFRGAARDAGTASAPTSTGTSAQTSFQPTTPAATWIQHERNVTSVLQAQNPGARIGQQVTMDITGPAPGGSRTVSLSQ